MHEALKVARQSESDVPVGAVLTGSNGEMIAACHNKREVTFDPTSHAEIEVIRLASSLLGTWRLENVTLHVTLEPCVMCAGAILAARIPRVIFGAWDEKVGASGSLYDLLRDARLGRPVEVIGGVLEQECSQLLADFFRKQR